MFRDGAVFMIYCFKAIKSPVDTKPKNSLTSYPAQHIYSSGDTQPPPHLTQKGILILLTEVMGENNGIDKNGDDFFFPLQRIP